MLKKIIDFLIIALLVKQSPLYGYFLKSNSKDSIFNLFNSMDSTYKAGVKWNCKNCNNATIYYKCEEVRFFLGGGGSYNFVETLFFKILKDQISWILVNKMFKPSLMILKTIY